MSTHLESATEKLQRAEQHIADFESGLSEFTRDNPLRLAYDPNPRTKQRAKLVRARSELPGSLICVVGDAVHNMRSALDHLATAVAVHLKVDKKGLSETHFTVRPTKADFRNAIKEERVTRLGAGWIQFLERMEPYYGGKAANLHIISTLDNFDKHRKLLVLSIFSDTFRYDGQNMIPVERGIPSAKGVTLALDPAEVGHHTHSQTRIVINESISGLDPNAWANTTLKNLAASVETVLDAAKADSATLFP